MCLCRAHSFHPHAIHDVCFSVVGPRSVLLLFLSVVYVFSSTLYLHFALHSIFNVNTAEGKKPLRLRTMRSIAPWRYTILSQHWTSLGRIASEVTIRRRLERERMEGSSRMGMFMFEPAARTVSIRVYGRYQNRREEKQS